jgi:hypothetical protein
LDDDFDAFTQPGTTSRTRSPKPWESRRRRGQGSDAARSSSPLKSDFDATTSTYVGTALAPNYESMTRRVNAESPLGHGPWNKVRYRRGGPTGRIAGEVAGHGVGNSHNQNRPNDGFEGYGEYGQYINDMEQMFGRGGSGEVKLSLTQLGHSKERDDSRQIGDASGKPVGPRSSAALIKVGTGRIGRPSRLGSVGKEGPKAGQDYEVVNRRVVEDGPERTVTISTWREQVANETQTGHEGELDVYYVGAEDYTDDDGAHGYEAMTGFDDRRLGRRAVTPSERRQGSGTGGPSSSSGGKTNSGGRRPSSEVRYP